MKTIALLLTSHFPSLHLGVRLGRNNLLIIFFANTVLKASKEIMLC